MPARRKRQPVIVRQDDLLGPMRPVKPSRFQQPLHSSRRLGAIALHPARRTPPLRILNEHPADAFAARRRRYRQVFDQKCRRTVFRRNFLQQHRPARLAGPTDDDETRRINLPPPQSPADNRSYAGKPNAAQDVMHRLVRPIEMLLACPLDDLGNEEKNFPRPARPEDDLVLHQRSGVVEQHDFPLGHFSAYRLPSQRVTTRRSMPGQAQLCVLVLRLRLRRRNGLRGMCSHSEAARARVEESRSATKSPVNTGLFCERHCQSIGSRTRCRLSRSSTAASTP